MYILICRNIHGLSWYRVQIWKLRTPIVVGYLKYQSFFRNLLFLHIAIVFNRLHRSEKYAVALGQHFQASGRWGPSPVRWGLQLGRAEARGAPSIWSQIAFIFHDFGLDFGRYFQIDDTPLPSARPGCKPRRSGNGPYRPLAWKCCPRVPAYFL